MAHYKARGTTFDAIDDVAFSSKKSFGIRIVEGIHPRATADLFN